MMDHRQRRSRRGRLLPAAVIATLVAGMLATGDARAQSSSPAERRGPSEQATTPPPESWLRRECPDGSPRRFKVGDVLFEVRLTPQFVANPKPLELIVPACPPDTPPVAHEWDARIFPGCETPTRAAAQCRPGTSNPYRYWTQVRGLPTTIVFTARSEPIPEPPLRPGEEWRDEIAGVKRLWREGKPWDVFLVSRDVSDRQLDPVWFSCGGPKPEVRTAEDELRFPAECTVGVSGLIPGIVGFYRFIRRDYDVPEFAALDLRFRRWLDEIVVSK